MSTALRIRKAREEDLPSMTRISIEAFRGRGMNEAKFPEHLRTETRDADRERLMTERRRARLDRPHVHVIVVVDDDEGGEERVLGSAEWQSVPEVIIPDLTPEQREARDAALPPCVDVEAIAVLERECALLDQTIRDALGGGGYDSSWCEFGAPAPAAPPRAASSRPVHVRDRTSSGALLTAL